MQINLLKTRIKKIDFPYREMFVEIFGDSVYLVGGSIRDYALYDMFRNGDIDLIVTGMTYAQIEEKLRSYGKTSTVGQSFAVVKFTKNKRTYDISVPRIDKLKDPQSSAHRNFAIDSGPHVSLEDDLGRRDFTCNSIALRLKDNKIVDPHNGISAISEKTLYMTGPDTFTDDPLRILRAARFAAVHDFKIDDEIYYCSAGVNLSELSVERVAEELYRILLETQKPSRGLEEYFALTILEKLFPELYKTTLTIQDSLFHPEKDRYGHHSVWGHTLNTLDICKKLSVIYKLDNEATFALLLSALLHDIGKPYTTRWDYKRGRMTVTSMFHDSKGADIVCRFMEKFKVETRNNFPVCKVVVNIVRNHHRVFDLYRNREVIGYKAVSRLVRDLGGYDDLLFMLDFADRQSREPDFMNFTEPDEIYKWICDKKDELNINSETIKPIIMGRDLLGLGIKPGRAMGRLLDLIYEKQLDGEFSARSQGVALAKDIIKSEKIL